MKKFLLLIVIIFAIFLLKEPKYTINENIIKLEPLMIAHAGGGIDNTTYTNSYEALNLNYKKGFKYFEIDFSFTKDEKLICLHDWKEDFTNSFGKKTFGPTEISTFNKLNAKYKYTKCTFDGLIKWLEEHPDALIITDIKENNIEALKIIKNKMKDKTDRIIPQIYYPKNFEKVKGLGFSKIIWTLYKYRGSNKDIINKIKDFYGIFAITMPIYKLDKGLIKKLKMSKITIFTHTINDINLLNQLQIKYKVDNIYTDFLNPKSTEK